MNGIYNILMQKAQLKNSAIIVSLLTLTSPLELIKIRLQTAHELLSSGKITETYRSITHCVSSISKMEGVRSLWKGNVIGIARFFPSESINLKSRQFLHRHSPLPDGLARNATAAVLSGWAASSLLYPFDTLRLALSSSTQKKPRITAILRGILRSQGVGYFFRGYVNSLMGTAIFRGSFNGIYDTAKSQTQNVEERTLVAYLSAVVAGGVCYPLDLVRRRRIVSNQMGGAWAFCREILKKEGVRGFYKGAKLILPQSLTGAAILLLFDTNGLPIFSPSD